MVVLVADWSVQQQGKSVNFVPSYFAEVMAEASGC
jgi:hypothetical protein